mgnify:CR=1 FL=1
MLRLLGYIEKHPRKALLAVLLFHLALYFVFAPVIRLVDDYNYITSAYDLLERGKIEVLNTFAGRWIIFPLVLSMKLFGVNSYTVTLPALLANMACIVLLYAAIPRKTLAVGAAFLVSCSYFSLFHSLHFMPDVFVNVCSLAFLVALQRYHGTGVLKWLLLGSLFLCLAVLMKLSALYLVLLFIAWLLITKKPFKHIVASFLVSSLIAGMGMLYYHYFFHDALFRLHVIEGEHNFSVYSYHGADFTEMLQRIVLGPLKLMVEFTSWGIVVGLSMILAIGRFKSVKNDFWFFFAVGLFMLNWFGSTSLAYYTPVPIYHRMWAGSFLFLLVFLANRAQFLKALHLVWAILPMLLYSLAFHSNSRSIVLTALLLLFLTCYFLKVKAQILAFNVLFLGFLGTWKYYPTHQQQLYQQFQTLHELKLEPNVQVYARHPSPQKEELFAKIEELESMQLQKFGKNDTLDGYLFHPKRITHPDYLKQIEELRKTTILVFENEHMAVFKSKP